MGAFYNSICIPGERTGAVREALRRWLGLRGFEERSEPAVLFDLDGEHERSAYLAANDRWTVLFYSHFDEERRLIRELQGDLGTLVYVWVYDSDVWGWDCFDTAGFRGSYSSDPRSQISFPDDEPGTAARPWAGPEALCRHLGLPDDLAGDLRRTSRRRSALQETVCRRFCAHLGVEVAVSSYDDLETGAVESLEGWTFEHLLFVARALEEPRDVRLHGFDVEQPQTLDGELGSGEMELSPELLAEVELMRRRARLKLRLLRPVSWIARAWRRLREAGSRRDLEAGPSPGQGSVETAVPRSPYRRDGRDLVNDRHGCRITLAAGARPVALLGKPASVFAFEAGDVRVTCTARRLRNVREVLRKPSRSRVIHDTEVTVGGLPGRHLVYELAPSHGSRERGHLALSVIQTDRAFYVFVYRFSEPLDKDIESVIRATVESFRLD